MKYPDKICLFCGKSYSKRKSLRPWQWAVQKFCCHDCAVKDKSRKANTWRATAQKTCPVCLKEFRPDPKQIRKQWNRKTVCSATCTSAHANGRAVGEIDPANEHDVGRRVRWLRLSFTADGKKSPMTQKHVADLLDWPSPRFQAVELKNSVTDAQLEEIASVLKVPMWIFSCSAKKFAKAVTASGLRAVGAVPRNEGGAE